MPCRPDYTHTHLEQLSRHHAVAVVVHQAGQRHAGLQWRQTCSLPRVRYMKDHGGSTSEVAWEYVRRQGQL